MAETTILDDYPDVPQSFKNIVECVYWGGDGGNPESPIYLCAMEWGGGFDDLNVADKNLLGEPEFSQILPEDVKNCVRAKWDGENVRGNGISVYRIYIPFLTALITGDTEDKAYSDEDLDKLIDKYEFFSKGHYGFLMNAFPLSMANRDDGRKSWDERPVVSGVEGVPAGEKLTYAQWTTLDTFDDYLRWTAFYKHQTGVLANLRRKYHPYIIYCGDASDWVELKEMWTDDKDGQVELKWDRIPVPGARNPMILRCCWLKNGEGKNDTLLVIGPFFSGQVQTLDRNGRWALAAKEIRKLVDERYPDSKAWLQPDKFIPKS